MRSTTRVLARLTITVMTALGVATRAGGAWPEPPAVTCAQDWRPAPSATYLNADGTSTSPPVPLPPPPTPQHQAFHVFCGGRYISTVWWRPSANLVDLYRAASDLVATARHPTAQPAANPSLGVTGLASWFWVTTTDSPLYMTAGNGPGFDLELRVETVRWRFGDGTTVVSGLGTPYPTPSPVQHVFERKGSYTVEAQVVIAGWFLFEELVIDTPTGGHTTTLPHEVAEIRSLLRAR